MEDNYFDSYKIYCHISKHFWIITSDTYITKAQYDKWVEEALQERNQILRELNND